MKRRRYRTIGEKREIVEEAYAVQGLIKQTARKYNVEPSNIRRWRRSLVDNASTQPVPAHHRTLNLGPATLLPELDEQLREFVAERIVQKLNVHTGVLRSRAVELSETFRNMSSQARNSWLYRFKERSDSSLRDRDRFTQSSSALKTTSGEFMDSVRTFISVLRVRPRLLLNMDHTAIALDVPASTSLHRVTVALCCAADGTKLKPLIVFKARPNGHIARSFTSESNGYPLGQCHFIAQVKGWMDDAVANAWIDEVLTPYLNAADDSSSSLLLLDTYKANHMLEVAHRINDLGCAIELVPSACWGISQPINIGVRGPFKSIIKRKWLEWVHEQESSADSAISPPTRADIANWIVSAWNEVSSEVVKKSFRHRPFHFVE